MDKNREAIEREIITFLDTHSTKKGDGLQPGCGLRHGIACALGTCNNNIPRVTPIDFFNDGLTLWMLGDPGGKLGNIRVNPNVSVGIYTSMDHTKENRSIQLWGKAQLVTKRHQEELFMERVERFGILDAIKSSVKARMENAIPKGDFEATVDKLLLNETLIKVTPHKIVLLIIPPDEKPEKLIWKEE